MELQLLVPKRPKQLSIPNGLSQLAKEDCKLVKARGSWQVSASPYQADGFQGFTCRDIHATKKLPDHQTTSLNYHAWEHLFPEDYTQRDFILNRIKDGFHINDPDCVSHSVVIDNYTSATAENVHAQLKSIY